MLGKWALEDFTPTGVAVLRYGGAAVAYLFTSFFYLRKKHRMFAVPRSKKEAVLFFLLGAAPFALSPILQMTGLSQTQSIDNAIVIAMEPLFTVILVWIFLREGMNLSQAIAFGVAMFGFLLVSKFDAAGSSPFENIQFMGSFLMLMALWGEATYVVCGRVLSRFHDPLSLFGSAIMIGVAILVSYAAVIGELPDLTKFTWKSGLGLLYLGPLGTAFSYMLWMHLIKTTPVASLVITLFVQPVFGSLWGTIWLGESFDLKQTIGALLILGAIGAQSVLEVRAHKKSSAA